MDLPPPILYHCPNGHIIGYITECNRRQTLHVFRVSKLTAAIYDFRLATKSSHDTTVYCSICGEGETWYEDPEKRRQRQIALERKAKGERIKMR